VTVFGSARLSPTMNGHYLHPLNHLSHGESACTHGLPLLRQASKQRGLLLQVLHRVVHRTQFFF
jgi:hypothetical protein